MSRVFTDLLTGFGGIFYWALIFGISALLAGVVWTGLEKLRTSRLGTIIKVPLCVLLVCFPCQDLYQFFSEKHRLLQLTL
jgi:hypothetical protein